MFENISADDARKTRQELDRQGYQEETTLRGCATELRRDFFGVLELELDQLSRVEEKEVLIMPSELVGRGEGKYVLYTKPKSADLK
jgi:hypothetical protein